MPLGAYTANKCVCKLPPFATAGGLTKHEESCATVLEIRLRHVDKLRLIRGEQKRRREAISEEKREHKVACLSLTARTTAKPFLGKKNPATEYAAA